jgi:hypothetical protein
MIHEIHASHVDSTLIRTESPFQLLFLLPGGLPRLFVLPFTAAIQAGGRPRRFFDRAARRSSTIIASLICSRSWRRPESMFKMSMTEG